MASEKQSERPVSVGALRYQRRFRRALDQAIDAVKPEIITLFSLYHRLRPPHKPSPPEPISLDEYRKRRRPT